MLETGCVGMNRKRLKQLVLAILFLGVGVAIGLHQWVERKNRMYEHRVANVCAQLQRIVDADPNYSKVSVNVEAASVRPMWVWNYRRAIDKLPVFLRRKVDELRTQSIMIVVKGIGDMNEINVFHQEVINEENLQDAYGITFGVQ